MNFARRLGPFILASLLGGCMTSAALVENELKTFRPESYAWAQAPGANTVFGRGIDQTPSGPPVTCAGRAAFLLPDGPYVRFNQTLMGVSSPGEPVVNGFDSGVSRSPPYLPPEAAGLLRRTQCGPDGSYRFGGLADGQWFVFLQVADYEYLYRRVRLQGGASQELDVLRSCFPAAKVGEGTTTTVCGVAPVQFGKNWGRSR